jgi:tellurite resistance protein TerC
MGFLKSVRQVKRFIVLVVGYTILFVGIALLILPGPAFIVIPVGLGILATELKWARRVLNRFKGTFDSMRASARTRRKKTSAE